MHLKLPLALVYASKVAVVPWLIPPAKRGLPLLMSYKQRYESNGPHFSTYIPGNESSSNMVTIIFIPSNQFNISIMEILGVCLDYFIRFHLVTKLKIIIIFLLGSFFLGRLSPIPRRPIEIAHQYCSLSKTFINSFRFFYILHLPPFLFTSLNRSVSVELSYTSSSSIQSETLTTICLWETLILTIAYPFTKPSAAAQLLTCCYGGNGVEVFYC